MTSEPARLAQTERTSGATELPAQKLSMISPSARTSEPGSAHRSAGADTQVGAERHHSFKKRVSDWGWRRALYSALMSALGRLGFRLHLVGVGAHRVDLHDPLEPEIPPGYVTRTVGKAELEPFVDKLQTNLSQAFLDSAFGHGDTCVACFYKDQLVAFSFDSRSRTTVTDQLDVLIPDGFKYGYKQWTHPEHRRRNLTKMISWVKRKDVARDFGERGIWYIETHNYASRLHGYRHPRLWTIRTGYVGWVTLFGRQIPFNSRWAKKIGFEFVRKDDVRTRHYSQ